MVDGQRIDRSHLSGFENFVVECDTRAGSRVPEDVRVILLTAFFELLILLVWIGFKLM